MNEDDIKKRAIYLNNVHKSKKFCGITGKAILMTKVNTGMFGN